MTFFLSRLFFVMAWRLNWTDYELMYLSGEQESDHLSTKAALKQKNIEHA